MTCAAENRACGGWRRSSLGLCLVLMVAARVTPAATFGFLNMDGNAEGLNDASAFMPVGGNNATTLGEARMNVLREAGRVWGRQISSNVAIVVEAQFDPLYCGPFSATLGAAGAKVGFANFRGAPIADVFYPAALADALSGSNINAENDIKATFNSALGSGSCLGGRGLYLGLDHDPGHNIDLLAVVLHELGHGLGFMSVLRGDGSSSLATGRLAVFDRFLYSEVAGQYLRDMSATSRQAALIAGSGLVWNSASVNAQTGMLGGGLSSSGGHLRIYAPFSYTEGASTSHWDTSAFWTVDGAQRQLLMEPYISANPRGHTDLTGCSLHDLGWQGTRCPDTAGTNFLPIAYSQTVRGTEDTPMQIKLQGTDADGPSALSFVVVSNPQYGTLSSVSGVAAANSAELVYTPAPDFDGDDSFSFLANDGEEDSSVATITISLVAVDDPPVAVSEQISATSNGATAIILKGHDAEAATLSYAIAAGPSNGALSGTGAYRSYTPRDGFVGSDAFSFYVNDGSQNSALATISISVADPVPAAGGGGAMGWASLLMLSLAVAIRRLITSSQTRHRTL